MCDEVALLDPTRVVLELLDEQQGRTRRRRHGADRGELRRVVLSQKRRAAGPEERAHPHAEAPTTRFARPSRRGGMSVLAEWAAQRAW